MSGDIPASSFHGTPARTLSTKVTLVRDHQACIPLARTLVEGDLLVLLSPVIIPIQREGDDFRDPFEPLGRALASKHPWVRHVPYTANNGITDYHTAFISRAKVIVFVISGAVIEGQASQTELADIARVIAEHRPQVIIACQDVHSLGLMEGNFPTILQIPSYAPQYLEETAAVLFGETLSNDTDTMNVDKPILESRAWTVEALPDSLDAFDFTPILDLWNECIPKQFQLDRYSLQSLLNRAGFGKHYVIRSPGTGDIIGFCATFTTWAFSDPEYLIGSLAAILVKPDYRRRGIGSSLHTHATDLLSRTRGVRRLQLGSTFPRLLYGIPLDLASHEWFRRRGWPMDVQSPGRGREVCDWLLRIQDWPSGGSTSVPEGFSFRQCNPDDFPALLQFVGNEAPRNESMGLFEEYKWSRDYAQDIVLCLHGAVIVAAALVYTPHSGTIAEADLPWARKIGHDVGGITCICIAEGNATLQNHRNSVMIRLLGCCVEILQELGMQQVFLDGMKGGDEGFQNLGFHKWARYREVWRKA
ncbi:hypothetical protein JX265_003901 [Neoarthrinium moseri]|uniref:N-acetyltransferase domain-containing protein n=1 Tax=Neoarthrinium moseri TaxID=1658444 RepID=A0A9P9WR91_9PEZI|nr:hypothetical protein JX265_003901 [Neoarthrinium moseri]